MLVLKRKIGQKVIVCTSDGNIEIMITKKGSIGVSAPRGTLILREELLRKERKSRR